MRRHVREKEIMFSDPEVEKAIIQGLVQMPLVLILWLELRDAKSMIRELIDKLTDDG